MTTPSGNVVTDSAATWATRTWAVDDKIDDGASVAEADLDEFAGALWANGVCQALADVNSAMNGATNVPAWTLAGPLTINGQSAPSNPASNAVALYSEAGVLKWKNSGGTVYDLSSAGGGVTAFMVDVPAASPATQDDYFTGTTLNVKWTEWDIDDDTVVSVHNGYCRMIKTADASPDSWSGIYQAVPSTTFTVSAYIGVTGSLQIDGDRAGLILFEDATDNNGNILALYINADAVSVASSGDIDILINEFSSYAGSSVTNFFNFNNWNQTRAYFRFRVSGGTTVYADVSSDGICWVMMEKITLTWTPSHVGWGIQQLADDATFDAEPAAICRWFRIVNATAAMHQDNIGDEMDIGRA